jgi:serine/threonine protein kinase
MGGPAPDEEVVFNTARRIQDAAHRAAYLQQACPDEAVRLRLEALLAVHEHQPSFLAAPAPPEATVAQGPVVEGPGTVVGKYKLLEQIGEGGFGVVFMAEQTEPVRRKVALKVIKPGMDTRQVIARFEAERQALALMDHPHIARVLEAGATASGRPYFVMELVRGVPITEYCDQRQLAPRERLELFVDVCHAVQHAHQKGIIHRDLKPTNVLVTLHDDRPVVKVIDFGVAKAVSGQLTERTLFTGFAQMIGTPLYMSPEQTAMSGLDVDTRSDVYSLGVLLYELLTGTTPLDKKRLQAAAYEEVLRIIREEEPEKPSTRISSLGDTLPSVSAQRRMEPAKLGQFLRGDLDWLVMKALEKDRTRRYETANAFAADVLRYLHDEPVLACPPSAGYRFRKFARRNKGALTAVAVVAATLLVGAVVSIGLAIWAVQAERLAQRRLTAESQARAEESRQRKIADERLAEAERQRKRADENLARARKAVKEYLTLTARDPRLQSADLVTLRRELLATAVPFLEEFVMQQIGDEQLEVDRGRAYGELAFARREMGDLEQAVADAQRALAVFAALADKNRNEPSHRANVAVSHDTLGSLLTDLGRHAQAEEHYLQALTIREKLVAEFRDVAVYREELAWTNDHHGRAAGQAGPVGQGEALLSEGDPDRARPDAPVPGIGTVPVAAGFSVGQLCEPASRPRRSRSRRRALHRGQPRVQETGRRPSRRSGLSGRPGRESLAAGKLVSRAGPPGQGRVRLSRHRPRSRKTRRPIRQRPRVS